MPPPELINKSQVEFKRTSFVGAFAAETKRPIKDTQKTGVSSVTAAMSFLGSEGFRFSGINIELRSGRPIPPPPDDETCESTIITGKDDFRTDADINTN